MSATTPDNVPAAQGGIFSITARQWLILLMVQLSNLVDVYVSNIRRKLGHELITTRRGQGYMIHG